MTQTFPLELKCPTCESAEVVYSCEPECCFNHVCGSCKTTFLTETRPLGGRVDDLLDPEPEPDTSDPTAPCCQCAASCVVRLSDGRSACLECGALLDICLSEIEPSS